MLFNKREENLNHKNSQNNHNGEIILPATNFIVSLSSVRNQKEILMENLNFESGEAFSDLSKFAAPVLAAI